MIGITCSFCRYIYDFGLGLILFSKRRIYHLCISPWKKSIKYDCMFIDVFDVYKFCTYQINEYHGWKASDCFVSSCLLLSDRSNVVSILPTSSILGAQNIFTLYNCACYVNKTLYLSILKIQKIGLIFSPFPNSVYNLMSCI